MYTGNLAVLCYIQLPLCYSKGLNSNHNFHVDYPWIRKTSKGLTRFSAGEKWGLRGDERYSCQELITAWISGFAVAVPTFGIDQGQPFSGWGQNWPLRSLMGQILSPFVILLASNNDEENICSPYGRKVQIISVWGLPVFCTVWYYLY